MLRSCAFLTTDDLEGFVTDDELAHGPLRCLGWEVEPVPWRTLGDPARFEAVVIRTPWDYPDDPDTFLAVLERVERSPARLANPLELVRWGLKKTYLRDLGERGVPVVPTVYCDPADGPHLERLRDGLRSGSLFDDLRAARLVVKPLVGANARDIRVVERQVPPDRLEATWRDRGCMVQPFVASVVDEGEYSLVFLGGTHSHTLLKIPGERDFRTQEEHGARLRAVEGRPDLVAAGTRAMATLSSAPLYARVDMVRLGSGELAVMELELVEPSLYLRMDPAAPERFARAFQNWVEGGAGPLSA